MKSIALGPRVRRASLLLVATLACTSEPRTPSPRSASVPRAELSLATNPTTLLDSADALIQRDSSVGMVTVDPDGRPRIRTVRAFRLASPASDRDRFTIYVLTRRSTRKVEHIAANPSVTLYFNEDHRTAYTTLMGQAVVHRNPNVPRLQQFLDSGTVRFFWPAFPDDFIIIEVVPQWLEHIGPGHWNDPNTWRPQAVVF